MVPGTWEWYVVYYRQNINHIFPAAEMVSLIDQNNWVEP